MRGKNRKICYLEIVQVDALLSVSHSEEGEHEKHGEDGPDKVPDRDDAGISVNMSVKLEISI